jgi:hypothetical protein
MVQTRLCRLFSARSASLEDLATGRIQRSEAYLDKPIPVIVAASILWIVLLLTILE